MSGPVGTPINVVVVAGNPKPASRTLAATQRMATVVKGLDADQSIDVITLGDGLLGWGDPVVATAVNSVAKADLVVVASPTFKASYCGVLKLFLDQFAGSPGLAGVVVVPVMLGAGPGHALAPELFLKPVLVELGAIAPAPGLYLSDRTYESDGRIEKYVDQWGGVLRAAVGSAVREPVAEGESKH